MRKVGWAVFACAFGSSGCLSINSSATDGGGDAAHVSIDSFSVTPTTVNDGESVTVTWNVSHTTTIGYVTQLGLYLGDAAGLDTAAERDARAFFTFAATQGGPNDASSSSITCPRAGNIVDCGGAQPTRDVPVGQTPVTFRACNVYAIKPASEVCDTQSSMLTFP
jgi:hypothetical protein